MGYIKFVGSMLLIGMFAFAIIMYSINFAIDNNANVTLEDDSAYTVMRDNIQGNATVYYADGEVASDSFGKMTVSSQTEATEGGTAFKVGPWTALAKGRSALNSAYYRIFGADSEFAVFLTVFISFLGFVTLLYIYKAWAGRNPD